MSTQPPMLPPARPTRPAARMPVAFLAIAGTCVLAAGIGGYVAQSHRTAELPAIEARATQPAPAAAPSARPTPSAAKTAAPADIVSSPAPTPTEALVSRSARAATPPSEPVEKAAKDRERPKDREQSDVIPSRPARVASASSAPQEHAPAPGGHSEPAPAVEMPSPEPPAIVENAAPAVVEPVARPQAAKVSIAETFTIPADSVLGLEFEHTVSSETAHLEDRVDARVTRDVKVDGTTVIPAGSRVRGAVTRVETGGRFKERGRIEIRFHTLVLADGDTQSIATEALFREGENVGRKTGARIGATAAGGAIIGAIFGGERGAAIGAAAGAGAGTAVTAAQKPSDARFRAGSVVTVRLTAPVSITVEQ